jgi:V-type H+-transporting ATPase subunit D
MALTTLKQRNLGAKKGYELLKKKSDALMLRLRGILKEIKQVRPTQGRFMDGPTLFTGFIFYWRAG